MKMEVIKRDGSIENFDRNKIVKVVTAAGLDPDQADTLANNMVAWTEGKKRDKVTSLQIRNKVLEELEKVDTYAANLFKWYERTKDLS